MAKPVYKCIFDGVFMVTPAEKRIRSSVFALYFGENTSDVSLWGLAADPGAQQILVGGRWLVPGRELNPDLGVHNGTRYPT